MKRLLLMATVAAVAIGVLGALPASSGAVTCKLKGSKKVKCPTGKLTGPEGPVGPVGPAGEAGAATVSPFKFLSVGTTNTTTFATFDGAVAEASCAAGPTLTARLRSVANNGAAESINIRTGTFDFQPDFDVGESVSLTNGTTDDQQDLSYMAAGGAQIVTAHFSAQDGSALAGTFDCALFGTVAVG